MIAGIVLAAGRSRRMGRPKPLLRLEGETFLARAVLALRGGGCGAVVVVAGPPGDEAADRTAAEAARLGAGVIRNGDPAAEQVDSLRLALAALPPEAGAAVVLPADVPRVDAAAVGRVTEAFRLRRAPIVRAVAGGRHGHPVLFARALWPELMREGLPEGARSVIHARAAQVEEVETGHPGILLDVDTPADLALLLGGAEAEEERP